mmetsp:Transcript_14121/g.10181  ORF Transcript_14121/g.10181 Transcript_14121/m.10181 type:complete len:181 (+) Transcript_14121:1108-1650(+)
MFFVQVACLQDDPQLYFKWVLGFVLSFVVILQACYYLYTVEGLKERASEQYEQYDQDTTTASDYTVQYKIHPEIYRQFLKADSERQAAALQQQFEAKYTTQSLIHQTTMFDREEKTSRAFRFKEYFTNEVEQILSEQPEQIKGTDIKRVKIAEVVFAYKNGNLIKLLEKRGASIINAQKD